MHTAWQECSSSQLEYPGPDIILRELPGVNVLRRESRVSSLSSCYRPTPSNEFALIVTQTLGHRPS